LALVCRSQWPRSLRRGSTAAHLLTSWVRIPPEAWMSVCCECCVLSGRGLCDEVITRPEESYRLWCVVVCDLEKITLVNEGEGQDSLTAERAKRKKIGLNVHLLRKSNIFLWRCDLILVHGLPLRGFTITLIGHTTLGRTHKRHTSTHRRDSNPQSQQASGRRPTP